MEVVRFRTVPGSVTERLHENPSAAHALGARTKLWHELKSTDLRPHLLRYMLLLMLVLKGRAWEST